jgi:hypothetical protein
MPCFIAFILLLFSLPSLSWAQKASSITVKKSDFDAAHRLTKRHRGVNFTLIGDGLQWDENVAAEADFYDVASDDDFIALFRDLGVDSVRIAGGTDSNYYDFSSNQGWVSWAVGSETQFNSEMDSQIWWPFYQAIGDPVLMTTANVYKSGNPDFNVWVDLDDVTGKWVRSYRDAAELTGAYWEAGNETYSSSQVPGMDFIPAFDSDATSYPARACAFAEALHTADPTAKAGFVLYDHGTTADFLRTEDVLDATVNFCDLDEFDFFILHDYAPLIPKKEGDDEPRFYHDGVKQALAYQDLTRTVGDLKAFLSSYADGALKNKPVHVTEYGLLYDLTVFGEIWNSEWYDKGVALLLANHYLGLVAQGADGLWFWEALSKWFRLIDPETLGQTDAYEILDRLFDLRGKLTALPISGGLTYDITGPIGTGCITGWQEECWHTALENGEKLEDQSYLRAYAVWSRYPAETLNVIFLNFARESQNVTVNWQDFNFGKGVQQNVWALSAVSWNRPLRNVSKSVASKMVLTEDQSGFTAMIPARAVVVIEVTPRPLKDFNATPLSYGFPEIARSTARR